jgi:hypothetical protein
MDSGYLCRVYLSLAGSGERFRVLATAAGLWSPLMSTGGL